MVMNSILNQINKYPRTSKICWQLIQFNRHTQSSSLSPPSNDSSNSPVYDTWTTIYKIYGIKTLAAISRLKEYQAALTAISVPATMFLESKQIFSAGSAELCATIGITGTITLSLYSVLAANLIGFVYVNQTYDKVRFGTLNFWGRRENTDILIKDLNANLDKKFGIYLPIKSLDSTRTYKLLPQFGVVLVPGVFSQMFGE